MLKEISRTLLLIKFYNISKWFYKRKCGKLTVCLLFNIILKLSQKLDLHTNCFSDFGNRNNNEQKHVAIWVGVPHGMSTLSRKLNTILFHTISDLTGFARVAGFANPSISKRWSTISESEWRSPFS